MKDQPRFIPKLNKFIKNKVILNDDYLAIEKRNCITWGKRTKIGLIEAVRNFEEIIENVS